MSIAYQHPLRTPAEMQARVSASSLVPKQLYVVQDGGTYYIAQALTTSTFVVVGRSAEPPSPALVAAIRAGTGTGYLAPSETWAAHAPVAVNLTALDMATFVNGAATISANTTIANPSNAKPGQSGWIKITISGTRTISVASNWVITTGDLPTMGSFFLTYATVSATEIVASVAEYP